MSKQQHSTIQSIFQHLILYTHKFSVCAVWCGVVTLLILRSETKTELGRRITNVLFLDLVGCIDCVVCYGTDWTEPNRLMIFKMRRFDELELICAHRVPTATGWWKWRRLNHAFSCAVNMWNDFTTECNWQRSTDDKNLIWCDEQKTQFVYYVHTTFLLIMLRRRRWYVSSIT